MPPATPHTDTLTNLVEARVASRIWRRDTTVFAPANADAAVHEVVRNRLGWLDAPAAMPGRLAEVAAVVDGIRAAGLKQICLLGMGGSSLCAEVLHEILEPGARGGSLAVLDTTDERAIEQVLQTLDPERAVFVVASKSGTTIEPASLERHFRAWLTRAGVAAAPHVIAITDPGTPIAGPAVAGDYRHVFLNPADIGGRYSALSLFGLVPAVLLDLAPATLLDPGGHMAAACRADAADNPGLALGAFIAASAARGRDKLTLLLPPDLAALGNWIEQLVAESTGKDGRGALPVTCEPAGPVEEYGADRAFVAVSTDSDDSCARRGDGLERAGHPVFRIETSEAELGGEFFRWEFATAVAGAALGVNPFDEPDVKGAKMRTAALLETYARTHALPINPPLVPGRAGGRWRYRVHRSAGDAGLSGGRYIAILDYLPTDRTRASTVSRIRGRLRRATRLATTHGYGPRYLHSTGQYHKGGPPGGLFILATAADERITPVPGTDYSFSVLKQAQALGDFESLAAAGRDVVHVHLDDPAADFSHELEQLLDPRDQNIWQRLTTGG